MEVYSGGQNLPHRADLPKQMICQRFKFRRLIPPDAVHVQKLARLYQNTFPHQAERLASAPRRVIEGALSKCAEPASCTCVGDWTVHGENLEAPDPGPLLLRLENTAYTAALEAALSEPGFFIEGNGGLVLPTLQ